MHWDGNQTRHLQSFVTQLLSGPLLFFVNSRRCKCELLVGLSKSFDLISHCCGCISNNFLGSSTQHWRFPGGEENWQLKICWATNPPAMVTLTVFRKFNPFSGLRMKPLCMLFHWNWLPRGFINLYAWLLWTFCTFSVYIWSAELDEACTESVFSVCADG